MWDLIIESERGERIDSCELWIQDLTHLIHTELSKEYLEQTHCLQFIDPYGNTVFNSLQTKVLISELEELEQLCQSRKDEAKAATIIQFLKKYGQVHTFIKFLGD